MNLLYVGIFLFGGSHLFSILFPAVRNRLQAWIGERAYKGAYSLISVVGVILMGWGYVLARGDGSLMYQPYEGARHVTFMLVLIGFILMASLGGRGYLRLWLQNPFSIGVVLWSVGHLLANGKTPVVAIYLTLLSIAVLDIAANMLRNDEQKFIPDIRRDAIAVALGLVVYAVALFGFHPYVLGVPVVQ
jgi:uncharacterized membrane protein